MSMSSVSPKTAREFTVLGAVQGVGFRPFVSNLACDLGITGTVQNNGGIVTIFAEGTQEAMDQFFHRLLFNPPKGALVLDIQSKVVMPKGYLDFQIISSGNSFEETPVFPPDLPLCEDCLQEMQDPKNRRYGYPLISCTSCGPRYSILQQLPYDREHTVMEDFPMCVRCQEEYAGEDRRKHAQTISCHDCGPQMIFQHGEKEFHGQKAMERAIRVLQAGGVLALKGIGGYQLTCLPGKEKAVLRLRKYKRREKKPLAIMVPSLQIAKELCEIRESEERLLTSLARPIVLLKVKHGQNWFPDVVSGESRFLGLFLPYTGVHKMLTDACGPLVMTSANLSGEPILIEDEQMLSSMQGLDGILYHKRRILRPLDDSVVQVVAGNTQLVRRSRGYVPLPIWVSDKTESPILSMGGDLKACFSLTAGNRVYLSQYFGDMEHYGVARSYEQELAAMKQIFHIEPKQIVCDLHPGYHTTALANRMAQERQIPLIQVQHHHAHIASVMAEYGLTSCIGVTFDGTGYGTDGTVWGGEFFYCKDMEFSRMAHLTPIPICGGDHSAKDASITAMSYCSAYGAPCEDSRFSAIRTAIDQNINTIPSSSMGRLFDAVSALLRIRTFNSYEGECAIALENAAAAAVKEGKSPLSLAFSIKRRGEILQADAGNIIRKLSAREYPAQEGALGFHEAAARMICEICIRIREKTGEYHVALSGGVFSNRLLTGRASALLKEAGFHVFVNQQVPCNDGGISLGQAWIAMHHDCKQRPTEVK